MQFVKRVLLQKTLSLTDLTNASKVSVSIPELLSTKSGPLSPGPESLPLSSFRGCFSKRSASAAIVFELYGFESFFASIGPSANNEI